MLPSEAVAAINAYRVAHLQPQLTQDDALMAVAQQRAVDVAAAGLPLTQASHAGWSEAVLAVFPNCACAENLAAEEVTAANAVAAWAGDYPHKANMLGNYNLVGIGLALSADGVPFWCADFVRNGGEKALVKAWKFKGGQHWIDSEGPKP